VIDTDDARFIRRLKLFGLPLLLAVGGIATLYITDNRDVGGMRVGGLMALLRWAALLLAAPFYTFFGGIGLCMLLLVKDNPSEATVSNVLIAFRTIGYTWVVGKLVWCIREHNQVHREKAFEKAWQIAKAEETKRAEEASQREFEQERAATQHEHRDLIDRVADLISGCGAHAVEMMRAAKAVRGGIEVMTPTELVLIDVSGLLGSVSEAHGEVAIGVARLYHGIQARIDPKSHLRVEDCIGVLQRRGKSSRASVPSVVLLLAMYDDIQKTTLAANAACVYVALVQAASAFCGDPAATKVMVTTYVQLLRPYINGSGTANSQSSSPRNGTQCCRDCTESYRVLDLSVDADVAQVKAQRRAMAELLHPDHLSGRSDNARRIAEEQMKKVNLAYDHILACRS
jgi:hypothetical protein